MTSWALFLLVWFLGTFVGTTLAILVVHVGSTRCARGPGQARWEDPRPEVRQQVGGV